MTDRHQFHIAKDKEAPEDRLHSSGPQQDSVWVSGIFRAIFSTCLTTSISKNDVPQNMFCGKMARD